MIKFKSRSHDTKLITKTLAAFETIDEYEKMQGVQIQSDSKKAQYLAKQIEEMLEEGPSVWKRYNCFFATITGT